MTRILMATRTVRHQLRTAALLSCTLPALLLPTEVRAQSGADRASLEQLSRHFAERLKAHRPQLYYDLLRSDAEPMRSFNANPNIRLMYIDASGHPVFYTTYNLDAAKTIATDEVWPGGATGLNLTGSTTGLYELGVWDNGIPLTIHQELTGRVAWLDSTDVIQDHATGVAGTMVASGVVGQAKGMAYQGKVSAYNWTNDLSEMATEAANRMLTSNHSYGIGAGWIGVVQPDTSASALRAWGGAVVVDSTEDYFFGYYDSLSMNLDQLAENAPSYMIVVAAGNERGEGPASDTLHWHWNPSDSNNVNGWVQATDHHEVDGGPDGYDCMTFYAVAKNVLTVGAVDDMSAPCCSDSAVIASFSSLGPTDDGRIKPDLVANGIGLFTPAGAADNAYMSASGTSQAAPSVTGSIDLLREYHQQTHGGANPRSATMKAILIQTAEDDWSYPGPDYTFGWGIMNTANAAWLIRADSTEGGRIFEDSLANGATRSYYLQFPYTPGVDTFDLRLTLAWTDPAGSPPSPALNDTTPMLVNDLDLRVTSLGTGQTYRPWILDLSTPASPATTGDNLRDNVEQISADLPFASGATYLVTVTHKGTLSGTQAYSLVSSRSLFTNEPWVNVTTAALAAESTATWGAAWGDYDGDRDGDLYLTNGTISPRQNQLLRNDGSSGFTDITSGPLADADDGRAGVWADYDNDGDLDLFVANDSPADRLLRNEGGGSFSIEMNNPPVGPAAGSQSASWADYDGDSDLDLFVVNLWQPNRLFRNDCSTGFVDVTTTPLYDFEVGYESATWVDFDNDNDPDLYVTAGTFWAAVNKLYRNDGGGSFVDLNAYPATNTRSDAMAWGDYDNDRDLDLFLGRAPTLQSDQLLRNDGGGTFVDVTPSSLGGNSTTHAAAWGDLDNDGRLDLFLANEGGFRHMRNQSGGAFAEVQSGILASSGSNAFGVALADYERDGDLDAFSAEYLGPSKLFRNQLAPGSSSVSITLSGGSSSCSGTGRFSGATANASAIGARVRAVAGEIGQIREVSGGSGGVQHSLAVHFGLGAATVIDTLEITWPGSGTVQTFTGVPPGDLQVEEGQGLTSDVAAASPPVVPSFRLFPPAPNPFNPRTSIRFAMLEAGVVRLIVYNALGQRVATLLDGPVGAGEHGVTWHGRDDRGRPVPSGIYLVRMESGAFRKTQKLVLLR